MFYIYIHLISEFDATTDNNSIYWFVKNIRVYLQFLSILCIHKGELCFHLIYKANLRPLD